MGRWLLVSALLVGAAVAQGPGTPPTPPAGGTPASGASGGGSLDDLAGPADEPTPGDSAQGTSTRADSGQAAPTQAAPDQTGDPGGGSVELTRKGKDGKERTIRVVKTGDDSTGIFAICGPRDDEPDTTPTEFVASDKGAGGVQVTVDKNLIQAPLAQVTKQQGGDGHIEMSTGNADYIPEEKIDSKATDRLTRCGVTRTPTVTPDTVLVTQGKTHLKGAKLIYDEKDGVARIDGPVAFNRPQDGGDPVNGNASRIEVSVDDEKTTLVGGVELKQGNRTSKADRVDYDDGANIAILHGTDDAPAETRTPTEVLKAQTIRYYLNTGEAVVEDSKGKITGSFQDGEPTNGSSAVGTSTDGVPTGGSSTQGTPPTPPQTGPDTLPPNGPQPPASSGTSTGP